MSGSGRVVVVTGAGQGLGRAHALALAAAGFRVVVNDVGERAHEVVREIGAAGGTAVASVGDVADWQYAEQLVNAAVEAYGQLDALVNNAGLVRDRMLVNLSEAEWDEVIRVDLKGHFAPLRHAAAYWRNLAKEGKPVAARVVNTSSGAGLMGSVGQSNYSAAKAGVAALTQVAAVEFARYGITVNAIAPSARTAMTEAVFADTMRAPEAVRRHGPRERLPAGGLARQRGLRRRHRAGVRDRRRRGQRRRRMAARRGGRRRPAVAPGGAGTGGTGPAQGARPPRRSTEPDMSVAADIAAAATDEEFREQVRDWLATHLTGRFAHLVGTGGPGREHEHIADRGGVGAGTRRRRLDRDRAGPASTAASAPASPARSSSSRSTPGPAARVGSATSASTCWRRP